MSFEITNTLVRSLWKEDLPSTPTFPLAEASVNSGGMFFVQELRSASDTFMAFTVVNDCFSSVLEDDMSVFTKSVEKEMFKKVQETQVSKYFNPQ